MIKGSLALMLSHGQRPNNSATTSQSLSSRRRICLGVQRVPLLCLIVCVASATMHSMTSPLSPIQKLRKQSQQPKHIWVLLRRT